jgi:L-serine dehydratase
MIEVTAIDDIPLSLKGDRFETLLSVASVGMGLHEFLRETITADEILLHTASNGTLIEITSRQPLPEPVLSLLAAQAGVGWVRALAPVLPILTGKNTQVPFLTCAQMLEWNRDRRLDLAGLAIAYESARGGIPEQEVEDRMRVIVRLLRHSIAQGLQGTRCEDRILGVQSAGFHACLQKGGLLEAGMLNTMILYATALMEVKSALGVIVAAPTAGACGALPAAVIAAAEIMGRPEADMARALLSAGLIGVFICAHSTFAAEVCGCQAECGAGSGMAAAALVTLAGGSAEQAAHAASLSLQNILGMVCDPVANRVEVPCLGRNVLAASNALACANMALAGFDPVIPLDEVITTMDRVGKSLPVELRCTGLGGLAATPTARAIAERLHRTSSS